MEHPKKKGTYDFERKDSKIHSTGALNQTKNSLAEVLILE
jgi:hypothetical protein